MKHADELKRRGNTWWKKSLTGFQKTIGESAIHRRNSRRLSEANAPATAGGTGLVLPPLRTTAREEETIVWRVESAHSQTYYFLSLPVFSGGGANAGANARGPVPLSVGPFPSVTEQLRKSDKIRLVRSDDVDFGGGGASASPPSPFPNKTKLCIVEGKNENHYVSCAGDGSVFLTGDENEAGTDWYVEERPMGPGGTGNTFRSKAYGHLFLSTKESEAETSNNNNNNNNNGFQKTLENLKNIPSPMGGFHNKNHKNQNNNNEPRDGDGDQPPPPRPSNTAIPRLELCASPTPRIWKLEPCTPRAVSSKRLKTFAIGTSIAVGTTIAMPFCLAGVAAAMGALGAEAGIGFGIVAAGLSGAEALASVGAIGATAYFCFKPENNSLRDDLPGGDGGDRLANPWSMRPFSNWRNW
mmetsp:Transcript_109356/g.223395  ORF Transcript_109356/g.223395 Transcript_109356/m.223395 type:complete len:412 (+) Transcript_109356:1219-2454(+)